ncbi:hypothetical protein [Agromyces sp. SYSU T0242]|uniref:hypothetical protein n=1 Tax=Agromyces litoreus TaxID=3158561 RepID=UPI0033974011
MTTTAQPPTSATDESTSATPNPTGPTEPISARSGADGTPEAPPSPPPYRPDPPAEGTPPGSSGPRADERDTPWYRRAWVLAVGALVIALVFFGAGFAAGNAVSLVNGVVGVRLGDGLAPGPLDGRDGAGPDGRLGDRAPFGGRDGGRGERDGDRGPFGDLDQDGDDTGSDDGTGTEDGTDPDDGTGTDSDSGTT